MLTTTDVKRLVSDLDYRIMDMEKVLPHPQSNVGKVALDYWFLNWISKQVDGKIRKMLKEAVMLGVIPDHKKHPFPPFTQKVVYSDDVVQISVSVNAPSQSVKWDAVCQQLLDDKVISDGRLAQIIHDNTVDNAPAHKFSSILIENVHNPYDDKT